MASENKSTKGNDLKFEIPVFILFGETLGYLSKYTKLAGEWCDGKVPAVHIQKMMRIDCLDMIRAMRKDYSEETVRERYKTYRKTILKEPYEKLLALVGEKPEVEVEVKEEAENE